MKEIMNDREREWLAEDDARALERLAELKNDEARLKRARAVLENKKKNIEKAISASGDGARNSTERLKSSFKTEY